MPESSWGPIRKYFAENAEYDALPNLDPVFSKQGLIFWVIESQLTQCKCIVKLSTMSYGNGKQLVRSGMLLMTRQVDGGHPPFQV